MTVKTNVERPADLVMNDLETINETYQFLRAILDDYSACKTELARTGLKRSLEIMIEKIREAHSRLLTSNMALAKDLEDAKKKIPNTEKELDTVVENPEEEKHILEEFKFETSSNKTLNENKVKKDDEKEEKNENTSFNNEEPPLKNQKPKKKKSKKS